jgi:hypothetical protein
MMDRQDMIAEANDLGLQFPGNISNAKLEELLTKSGEPTPIEDDAPPSPAMKAVEPDELPDLPPTRSDLINRRKRAKIARAKKAAMTTQIVTITNKDPRENDVVTTAFLSFENQYFGKARNVPLDIPVELEVALISIAEGCIMTMHKDEVVNNRRTGNKITQRVKKYAVSYSQRQPS